MPTFNRDWSTKLRKISDLERPDHSYLGDEDACYFFGEYTPKNNSGTPAWNLSKTNSIVLNLKKSPQHQFEDHWKYKQKAIRDTGALIRKNIHSDMLPKLTFVPAPSSKPIGHPEYDTRMIDVANEVGDLANVCPILRCVEARDPLHQSDQARSYESIYENIEICEAKVSEAAITNQVILLDDVITTGATFVACKSRIIERFPRTNVYGLFIARRVPDNTYPT